MSTSLLYHGFAVRGYRYLRTEQDGGMTLFHVEPSAKSAGVTGTPKLVDLRGQIAKIWVDQRKGAKDA